MNIQEITENFKSGVKRLVAHDELYTLFLVVLVGVAAFGLGQASVVEDARKNPLGTTAQSQQTATGSVLPISTTATTTSVGDSVTSGMYVASKSGSKYHLPWCGGAKQIKEANKVWFATKEAAEDAGYTPAANCKGI